MGPQGEQTHPLEAVCVRAGWASPASLYKARGGFSRYYSLLPPAFLERKPPRLPSLCRDGSRQAPGWRGLERGESSPSPSAYGGVGILFLPRRHLRCACCPYSAFFIGRSHRLVGGWLLVRRWPQRRLPRRRPPWERCRRCSTCHPAIGTCAVSRTPTCSGSSSTQPGRHSWNRSLRVGRFAPSLPPPIVVSLVSLTVQSAFFGPYLKNPLFGS